MVRKRPRGLALKGMEWREGDGRWVERPQGQAAPVTDLTVKVKPRGQPPNKACSGMRQQGAVLSGGEDLVSAQQLLQYRPKQRTSHHSDRAGAGRSEIADFFSERQGFLVHV